MESLFDVLSKRPLEVKTGRQPSERDLIIGELFKKMDADDRKIPYYIKNGVKKPKKFWTISRFAAHMAPHSLEQLYFLKSTCADYQARGGNYGKCLMGAIKVKQ